MSQTHHQQVHWWEWPFPLVSRTCVCGGAVSSACSVWCCGDPRSGLHCWSGGALLHLSSPSSQRGVRSEPCYVSGTSSLSHPDRRISGLCYQDGRGAAWDLEKGGGRQVWWGTGFFAAPKWMLKCWSWSPLGQATYKAVGNNPDLH